MLTPKVLKRLITSVPTPPLPPKTNAFFPLKRFVSLIIFGSLLKYLILISYSAINKSSGYVIFKLNLKS